METDNFCSITFPNFLKQIINNNDKEAFVEHAKNPNFIEMIKATAEQGYLHTSLRRRKHLFKELASILGSVPKALIEQSSGDSLLQACSSYQAMQLVLSHFPDLDFNHKNNSGDTVLHYIVSNFEGEEVLNASRNLLIFGANPNVKNNKNQTFWTLPSFYPMDGLSIYRRAGKNGQVLSIPPLIKSQYGPTCGFYSVDCINRFFRSTQEQKFTDPYIPARKRDTTPRSTTSLRALIKELNLKTIGPIFSVKHLQSLIAKTECTSEVVDITCYQEFLEQIQFALVDDYPIIIPFSADLNSGKPDPAGNSRTAHWATIIGYSKDEEDAKIILAQFGQYYEVEARALFDAFYNMQERFPGYYYSKMNKEYSAKPLQGDDIVHVKPESLKNFRRKLIITKPPDADLKRELDVNIQKFK